MWKHSQSIKNCCLYNLKNKKATFWTPCGSRTLLWFPVLFIFTPGRTLCSLRFKYRQWNLYLTLSAALTTWHNPPHWCPGLLLDFSCLFTLSLCLLRDKVAWITPYPIWKYDPNIIQVTAISEAVTGNALPNHIK